MHGYSFREMAHGVLERVLVNQDQMIDGVTGTHASVPLPLKSVRNVRDLGGYPFTAENGACGVTAFRAFVRAGSLRGISAGDIEALRQYGVRRIVDLRSPFELKHMPDDFSRGRRYDFEYVSVPMLDQLNSNGFGDALPERMSDVYIQLMDEDADDIRAAMEALDGEGASLFHCRAGKDRTGVIAMLLLGLAGVDDDFIVADYEVSDRYMGHGLQAQRLLVSLVLRKRAPKCLFESNPEEMRQALAHLHTTYGTARTYLHQKAACDPNLLDRITRKLQGTSN